MIDLAQNHIDADRFHRLIELAKEEDLSDRGDITTQIADRRQQAAGSEESVARLVAQQDGIVSGLALVPFILNHYEPVSVFKPSEVTDGSNVKKGTVLGTIEGELGTILMTERVVLNFLQRLSGVATSTWQFVEKTKGTDAKIYDTRKTTPGLRDLEKYAVRCGGGQNHRQGLYDAILVKDNHLAGVAPSRLPHHAFEILNRASSLTPPPAFIEFEVDSLDQLGQLLKVVGIDIILLDNFSVDDLRRAVQMRDEMNLKGKVQLEASGGVNLDTVRAIAETGVERISVGALTHSAIALNISLEI